MSNVCAAIGRGQLTVLDERVNQRRDVFARYESEFGDVPGFTLMPEAPFGRSTRWLTAATVDPKRAGVSNVEIMDALAEENIESRPVWKPMHLQPVFDGCRYYPHAEGQDVSASLFRSGICLPSGSNLTSDDLNRIMDCLGRVLHRTKAPKLIAAPRERVQQN